MNPLGHKNWVIAGGNIPLRSTGREPEFLSQDRIAVLNTGNSPVEVSISVIFSHSGQVDGYKISIAAKRLRKIRINDLIDPLPVPLETDYALIVSAESPVLVQFFRMNTSSASVALAGAQGYGSP